MLSGCHREAAPSGEQTPPIPDSPAVYGPPVGTASSEVPRVHTSTNATNWASSAFHILHTELSPATLIHSSSEHLDLFSGSTNSGLGAPSCVAWATVNGPRTFKRGESLNVTNMAEGWVLVWWSGAVGWTSWDSPWVIYLQHNPDTMRLDEDGLHLQFPRAAGDVVLMPLYGYDKLPPEGRNFREEHGLKEAKVKVKTWEWPKVVTRDPLTRIRYWAAATRRFPIRCEETFSVDRANDSVTIRSRFEWRTIEDDWKTRHIKLAPLSPSLALAVKLRAFPVELSGRWFDLEMPTRFGPYLAIDGVDQYDATFSVLQYVNETEAFDPPATNAHPNVQLAMDHLRAAAARAFPEAGKYLRDEAGTGNLWSAIPGHGWIAKALPYFDESTRSNAIEAMRKHFRDEILVAKHFTPGSLPNGFRDSGTLNATVLESLWAYAHFTGDWDLVRDRWPLVKELFITPEQSGWAGFGRAEVAEIGDEAAHSAAFARMAYKVGDMDSYNYACYVFARQLTLLFLKQRGAEYFRQHQPWHSMEYMDAEVFLTSLRGDSAGWQLDGPKYPSDASARQFEKRWVRFNDADVARFYREYLKEDVRRELNWFQHRWGPERRTRNDPSQLPSLIQLRSLLINESPSELAALGSPEQFTGPLSGQTASCLSVLRTSHPTRFERLIPGGDPSPFVVGLEREFIVAKRPLLVTLQDQAVDARTKSAVPAWPLLTWPEWRTPTGAPWTFGSIRPGLQESPRSVQSIPLNWNSQVLVFDMP